MRKLYFFLSLLFFTIASYSQESLNPKTTSTYIKCSSFSISKPLRELAVPDVKPERVERDLPRQVRGGDIKRDKQDENSLPDPVIQQSIGNRTLDTTLVNFEGGDYYRPDATGAANADYYVQGMNLCNLRIYDKNGNIQLVTSMTALGGGCSDDPIVLYDKFADRWVIADVTYNYMNLSIAVSTTGDPTGSYYIYTYPFAVMPDFPKISIWTDGYYACFRNINNDTVGIGVFERNRMLAGDASAGFILSRFPNTGVINSGAQLPGCAKIMDCDGALPPYGSPNFLIYFTNTNYGDAVNSIRIYKMITDTTVHTCNLVFDTALVTAAFNANFTTSCGWGAIHEPGGQAVWSLDGPFQYRVPYIKFTGYNSAVLCNTVNLGNCIAGIRWYELRQSQTTQKWSIYQQSTYGPNDTISRWNGSICMDLNGDISLAYNVTNSTTLYPGIRYTGRLAADPSGQMTFAEQTAYVGTHSFATQWGDYSESSLDPDGLTFWHTNQYIKDATGNTANTRIFAFRLTSPVGIASMNGEQAEFSTVVFNNNINVRVKGLASDNPVVVNLFDIDGKELSAQWITPAAGGFENKISVSGLAKGAYLVRIGNSEFQKVKKVILD